MNSLPLPTGQRAFASTASSTSSSPGWPYPAFGKADTSGERVRVCPVSVAKIRRSAFLYKGPLVPGWEVVKPLALTVERDSEGWYIISDDVFLVYGTGPTWTEALHDYAQSLTESYQITERSAQTNEYDRPVLDVFRSFISCNP